MHGLFVRLVHRIRRHFRIQGQAPTVQWKQNDCASVRSIHEAVAIAQTYGVVVPEDVTFFVAAPGELKGSLSGLMKEDVRRILDEYEEGRITATGFILDILNKVNHADLKEALESLPVDLVERVREFVVNYRPEMKVFRGPPPDLIAVNLAKELLAAKVTSTSAVLDPS
jgi:hypothetical protein